jgi:hypothetical protein
VEEAHLLSILVDGREIGISGTNTNFEAAAILPLTYMSVPGHPPCAVYNPHPEAFDKDDNYLDQTTGGWNSQQPERVAVLCRAQWRHARFREILTAWEGSLNYLNESWPPGFPADWDTINTVLNLNGNWTDGSPRSAAISVNFKSLAIDMSAPNRPGAHGSVVNGSTITVHFQTTGRIRASFNHQTRSDGPTVRSGRRLSTP